MLLTQETGILKPFALFLGKILEGIFFLLDSIGIHSLGITIILFTFVVYILLSPLTYKQQKFSKFQSKMSPELEAIKAKYNGKQDQDSMMKMNQETQLVYGKYGVSPAGTCLPAFIQIPLIWTLYRIINNIPAYVPKVKNVFFPLVDKLYDLDKNGELLQTFKYALNYKKLYNTEKTLFSVDPEYTKNVFINILNKASSAEWSSISEKYNELSIDINNTLNNLNVYNLFLGLNISDSPSNILSEEWSNPSGKNWVIIVMVIMLPILSALSQWLNIKIMNVGRDIPKSGNGQENTMAQSMEIMNKFMPIFSLTTVFVLPVGVGIYWICGAIFRTIIQIVINKKIDKIDIDELVKKNMQKVNMVRAKQGLPAEKINNNATKSTKKIEDKKVDNSKSREALVKDSTEYYKNASNAKEGSLASKAFMVKQYNEKNNKNGD